MSSIIASREPPAVRSMPVTGRGSLSSTVRPRDCASRRAGSMVRTTTLRPASAARTPIAAAVVVLPTPPEPQHTMMRVPGSRIRSSMSNGGALGARARLPVVVVRAIQAIPWSASSSASSRIALASMPSDRYGSR